MRIIKLAISLLFFLVISVRNILRKKYFNHLTGSVVFLTYHSIRIGEFDLFTKQLDYIIKKYQVISINQLDSITDSCHYIAITFDDALESFYDDALPELIRRDIPASLFVPVYYLGKTPDWLSSKNDTYCAVNEKVISVHQLKSIPTNLITIGSHGMTHKRLTNCSADEIKYEVEESKFALERLIDKNVDFFSFPFNDYNANCVASAKKANYRRVFKNVPIFPSTNLKSFVFGRIDISPNDWHIELVLKCAGAYQWLPLAIDLKKCVKKILVITAVS